MISILYLCCLQYLQVANLGDGLSMEVKLMKRYLECIFGYFTRCFPYHIIHDFQLMDAGGRGCL